MRKINLRKHQECEISFANTSDNLLQKCEDVRACLQVNVPARGGLEQGMLDAFVLQNPLGNVSCGVYRFVQPSNVPIRVHRVSWANPWFWYMFVLVEIVAGPTVSLPDRFLRHPVPWDHCTFIQSVSRLVRRTYRHVPLTVHGRPIESEVLVMSFDSHSLNQWSAQRKSRWTDSSCRFPVTRSCRPRVEVVTDFIKQSVNSSGWRSKIIQHRVIVYLQRFQKFQLRSSQTLCRSPTQKILGW